MTDLSFLGNYVITTTSYLTYFTSNDQIASQNGDFLVFDFTNPAAPQFLTSMQPSSAPGSGNLNLIMNVNPTEPGGGVFITNSTWLTVSHASE